MNKSRLYLGWVPVFPMGKPNVAFVVCQVHIKNTELTQLDFQIDLMA